MDKDILRMDNKNLAVFLEFEAIPHKRFSQENFESVVEVKFVNPRGICRDASRCDLALKKDIFYNGCATHIGYACWKDNGGIFQ